MICGPTNNRRNQSQTKEKEVAYTMHGILSQQWKIVQ